METLFNYILLPAAFNLEAFREPDRCSMNFLLPASGLLKEDRKKTFLVLADTIHHFAIFLDHEWQAMDEAATRDAVRYLLPLFFLPQFMRNGESHLCYASTIGSAEPAARSTSRLIQTLALQGIRLEVVRRCQAGNESSIATPRLETVAHAGYQDVLPAIEAAIVGSGCMQAESWIRVVPIASMADAQRKMDQLKAGEARLQAHFPQLVKTLQTCGSTMRNNLRLEHENRLLKTKLHNNTEYLALLRKESADLLEEADRVKRELQMPHGERPAAAPVTASFRHLGADEQEFIEHLHTTMLAEQARANETFDWYQQQYEVLPRWFKRAGQLIRVLTGKRSLQSLLQRKKSQAGIIPGTLQTGFNT